MMRILLTGTTGQIGSALCPLLQHRGVMLTPSMDEFDLSRPADLPLKLDRLSPDLIINPAAYTAVDRAEEDAERAFRVNAEAPAEIAQWAARHGVPLIHFSTDYVFDGSGSEPWREDSLPAPLSVYGASKLSGDNAIRAAGGPHIIARTSWVYAAQGVNFLQTILRLSRERKELRIVADQFGAPTSASVIAEAIARILPCTRSRFEDVFVRRCGIVNLVCAGETTFQGFASAIVRGLRERGERLVVEAIVAIGTAEFPAKARRPANSRLDTTRLREVFGISVPSWEEALERELDKLTLNSQSP